MLVWGLQESGYEESLLRSEIVGANGRLVPLTAFAHSPADVRSACISVLEVDSPTLDAVVDCRDTGAPIVLMVGPFGMEWWKQSINRPERAAPPIPPSDLGRFFGLHNEEFAPDAVYRAKTWGRFQQSYQLWFVDRSLMPLVESEIGERLVNLIIRNVDRLKTLLKWKSISDRQGQWLLKTVFWIVSAKILRDKDVGKFSSLDLLNVPHVLSTVAEHFGTQGIEVSSDRQLQCLSEVAEEISKFSNLHLATTESLAHVYENTMVSSATRQALGTHSTPSYLVDYIVGRLKPLIENMDIDARRVFEPACGHCAFLVSAIRLLTELLPPNRRSELLGKFRTVLWLR